MLKRGWEGKERRETIVIFLKFTIVLWFRSLLSGENFVPLFVERIFSLCDLILEFLPHHLKVCEKWLFSHDPLSSSFSHPFPILMSQVLEDPLNNRLFLSSFIRDWTSPVFLIISQSSALYWKRCFCSFHSFDSFLQKFRSSLSLSPPVCLVVLFQWSWWSSSSSSFDDDPRRGFPCCYPIVYQFVVSLFHPLFS